jgi:phosphoribosylanthranilate isomerase
MPRTRVKICGITRPEDGRCAAALGADAIGLVFFRDSPRHVTSARAGEIIAALDPFVTVVGLFVNAAASDIEQVLGQVPLDLLQFHGQEPNEDCRSFGIPFIKSIAMRPGIQIPGIMAAYPDARGFLLDTWQPQTHGGGGEPFDWQQIPADLKSPFILAGGLDPGNVTEAIRRVRPYAVDVSSGVETAPGIKSADKIAAFINGVSNSGTDTDN